MPGRPTWSGSLQISLVSIAVKIFPATNPGRQVEFHQIDRKTHQRIHHQNVDEQGEVAQKDIVKGYEYARNKYIEIDTDELKAIRIPTATTMQIKQFVKADELFECEVREEHEVLQKAELSGTLIQRTTLEAPQRLCITSDWTYTRGRSAIA